jgi:hypothetical protein
MKISDGNFYDIFWLGSWFCLWYQIMNCIHMSFGLFVITIFLIWESLGQDSLMLIDTLS